MEVVMFVATSAVGWFGMDLLVKRRIDSDSVRGFFNWATGAASFWLIYHSGLLP